MTSEVTDLIAALRAGTMSLDEVAGRFRERSWPDPPRPKPQTEAELAARLMDDPDPYIPGSFDEVNLAYDRQELTEQQYRILAEAASEAMAAEDRRKRG
jgi:hypothetical protein